MIAASLDFIRQPVQPPVGLLRRFTVAPVTILLEIACNSGCELALASLRAQSCCFLSATNDDRRRSVIHMRAVWGAVSLSLANFLAARRWGGYMFNNSRAATAK